LRWPLDTPCGPPQGDFSLGQTWFRIRALEPDVLYRIQVQAFNLEGDGEWSSPSYALHTPAVPETPVDAPDVTGKSHNSIRLRWDAPKTRGSVGCPNIALKNLRDGVCTTAGPGTAVTGYRIYVSYGVNGDEGPQGGPITRSGGEFDDHGRHWAPLGVWDTGMEVGVIEALSYEVVGCTPSLMHGFRIAAINAAGEGVPGPPLFVSTDTVPDPPGAPEFHAKTHSSISLMWFPARTDPGSPVLAYRLFGGRWDWDLGWWVPIEPSVLSIKQRTKVVYEDLVVEYGDSPHPWPEELDQTEWGELWLPPLDDLERGYKPEEEDDDLDGSGSGSWSESWDWAQGGVTGAQTLDEWRGRRQQEVSEDEAATETDMDEAQDFDDAGWSRHASEELVEVAAHRRLEINASNYHHSMYIRGGDHYQYKPYNMPADTLYHSVNYLMNNEYYRFKVVAINAAGQGNVSSRSQPAKLLDAPITELQMYSGPPCMYQSATVTNFMAVSDGSGAYYRWTTERGGTAGRCQNDDCSLMEYQYVNVGENTLLVTAINNVGQMLGELKLNVSYCGCTDRQDPNYWWLATYHLPTQCANIETWPDVDKRVAVGETKYFDLPIPEDAYHSELIIRVQRGAVGVYISKTRLPDILSNVTYDQRFVGPEILDEGNATGTYKGIETFALMDTWYQDLSGTLGGELTGAKWLFIAVVGFHSYSEFELVGKVTQFNRGYECRGEGICIESSTRRNLQDPIWDVEVVTPYYDFYEYYFEAAALLATIDVQVTLTVLEGCVQLYASQDERYPSPKRAGGIEYGYMPDKTVGGCASMTTHSVNEDGEAAGIQELGVVFNIEAADPRVLYISVQGADMENMIDGEKPPLCKYSIEVESFDYNMQSQAIQGQETLEAGGEIQDVVIADNFKFFEIRISDAATTVELTVTALFGVVDLFVCSTQKPTQSVYDVRVRDSDEDGVLQHTLNFADIDLNGYFYIGIFGLSPSSSFLVNVVEDRLEDDEVLTIITQEWIDEEDFVNGTCCGPTCRNVPTPGQLEEEECQWLKGYKYYFADRRVLAIDEATNETVDITSEVLEGDDTVEQTVFDWTGPYSEEYLEANFNSRTKDIVIELEIEGINHNNRYYPIAYLGDSQYSVMSPLYSIAQEAVVVTVYGSSLDPFPGLIRTYDVMADMDLRETWELELVIPLFMWSGMPVWFSIHSPTFEIEYKMKVREIEFDRSVLLSEDTPLPPGLCVGQQTEDDPPCSGHGSCVGYNDDDTPLAATCFCNAGWIGPSCAIERFPAWPLVTIVSPNSSSAVNATVEKGVQIEYITQLHPNNSETYMWDQKQYWPFVELVLYVDGRPYPQPYPNNVFVAPEVNESIPEEFSIHNLQDGAPHNVQLYVMYAPEYAVLQIISLDFYLGTIGPGCTESSDCSDQGLCYRGYCVCFDGWIGADCSLREDVYVDSFLEAQNGSTAQGFRDRLVTTLERKALGVGYETQVMVDSTQTYMNKQDGSLLLRLQEAIDQVNAGRAWNKETVDYFLKKHGDEAEQKAAERAQALQELRQQFDELDAHLKDLKDLLGNSRDHVHNLRKAVEARLRQLRIDYEWERRVKYAEWRMVKERALFNMDEVANANGPRVAINKLQKQVCTKDNKFRTECHYEDLATPIVTPVVEGGTQLMNNYDISGETYAEFTMHETWEEYIQVAMCNATCHGHVDPCDSPVLADVLGLDCSDLVGETYIELGLGFCRDQYDTKPNGYYKRVASMKLCSQYCGVGPTCLGYAWSKEGLCYLYYSDFVGRAGTDFAGFYEHWHVIPTGWAQFLPQGSAGSSRMAAGDGNPTRRCYVKEHFMYTGNGTELSGSPEPEPEPEPEPAPSPPSWLTGEVEFGELEPSDAVVSIGSENNVTNNTACWTGQQFLRVYDENVAIGGIVVATPVGDVHPRALVDANLDRNWHSRDGDGQDFAQQIDIALPGNDDHHQTYYCISGLKLYWRNVYTAAAYMVNSSTDGITYTPDLLEGAAMNVSRKIGRIDEYNFALHDARHVQLRFLKKQEGSTLDYDLLEAEVYGLAGKCNDTFGHEPEINATSQLAMLQQMQESNGDSAAVGLGAEDGSVEVESTYAAEQMCNVPPGQPAIDDNGDWNCGPLSRVRLVSMCMKMDREPTHPAPPMDPGPKNLLEYLGLEWEMREAMLAQTCVGWDVIRTSEKEICFGEVVEGWADDSPVPSADIIRAHVCPTSGRELPTCRLFNTADHYHPDARTISGAINPIMAKKTEYRYDDFEQQPGYTMEVIEGLFGQENLREEMAEGLYTDVPR